MGAESSRVTCDGVPNQASTDLQEPIDSSPTERLMSTPYDPSSQYMTDFLSFGEESAPPSLTGAPYRSSTPTYSYAQRFSNSSQPTISTRHKPGAKNCSSPGHLCSLCSRFFASREALESHWTNAKRHNRCQRCDRFFHSATARMVHYNNSSAHWICNIHDLDFNSREDLYDHYRTEDSHYCCDQGEKIFGTAPELHAHSLNHNPQDLACWCCDRVFKNYSSMLNHLETETCAITRIKLDKLAVDCPYSRDYVRLGCENHLRNGNRNMYNPKPIIHRGRPRKFGCSKCDVEFSTYGAMQGHLRLTVHHPLVYQCAGCEMRFADLSALLQHAESSACDEGLSKGTGSIAQLLRYLWLKIGK